MPNTIERPRDTGGGQDPMEAATESRVWTVALAGNPNSGKSTLFNALTGLHQKVGNYPGVTIEKRVGHFRGSHGESMDLLDLPGTYSLQARSPDEAVTRDVLMGRRGDTPAPDVILCVVDATNLERNLYLVAQLAELGRPMVVALVMMDLAERDGWTIDVPELARRLGCPVVSVIASQRKGLVELRQAITQQLRGKESFRATLPPAIEAVVRSVTQSIAGARSLPIRAALAESLLLVTGTEEQAQSAPAAIRPVVSEARNAIAAAGLDTISASVHARYAWVETIVEHTVRRRTGSNVPLSERLDAIFTHRIWGWLVFAGVMAVMFFMIFRVAEVPMGWIESGQDALSSWIEVAMPAGDFRDLLTNGIVAGVGGVVIFLPQILILFFFLGLLEDTGYLARAAFIMDRAMSRVGLHGKSFIPMLSSFACAIPGIMSARTIDNSRDRLVTILVAPLVSCSARLPVYTLLIAVMLASSASAWLKAGLMLALYALGVGAAFGMAWVFRRTLLKGERSLLLLEMPPYRCPSLRVTLARMRERAGIFLRQAGTVILAISVLIWALSTYPKPGNSDATPAQALANSVAGRVGQFIEPVIKPLGYDWKIGIGILSSFAAREVFVGTMSVIYSIENGEEDTPALRDAMLGEKGQDGRGIYSPLVCLSLMVFYVLAMQCLSTLVVVRRETGSWRWPLLQLAYMTALAWLGAFIIFQGGRILGFS